MHSNSRNRLTTKHVTDLEWLFSNLCLAKRTQSLEQQHKALPWVVLSEKEEEQRRRGPAERGTSETRIRAEHSREDAELHK